MRLASSFKNDDGRVVVLNSGGVITMNSVSIGGNNSGHINVASSFIANGDIIGKVEDKALSGALQDLNRIVTEFAPRIPDEDRRQAVLRKCDVIVREAAAPKPDTALV